MRCLLENSTLYIDYQNFLDCLGKPDSPNTCMTQNRRRADSILICVAMEPTYCSATDSETTTFGRFYTGQAMSHMRAFPEFFVRSLSVKYKHHPSILHPPHFDENNCARRMRKSDEGFESVAK
ncbi:hypothetical protein AVEN_224135-1 [Araneus ventricosus]|uniref:Uncharacterized protein n=1 Tax=Araneus ventricosus TaxID=182803 RepID=A0A4Y2IGR6_ARAVE|nr:hypothetical protein AVEN_224135-1 [Araneus ventricosus]